jgi:hypothetical protein
MGAVLTYFRHHKWQRRMLTALLGVILAAALSIHYVPAYLDQKYIEQLRDEDQAAREQAAGHFTSLAARKPETRQRLFEALATEDDEHFRAIQQVLAAAGHWPPPVHQDLWIDRLQAIQFEKGYVRREIPNPDARRQTINAARRQRLAIVHEAILASRDNRYVRRLLRAALADPQPRIRRAAATLAGKLNDPGVLGKLLADEDAAVAAEAALVAGLTGQATLAQPIRDALYRVVPIHQNLARRAARVFTGPQTADQQEQTRQRERRVETLRTLIANSSLALLTLRPQEDAWLAELAGRTQDGLLRERLLWLLSAEPRDATRRLLDELAARYRWQGQPLPADAILAARRIGHDGYAAAVLDVLRRAGQSENPNLQVSQLLAAVDYARAMNLPCRQEAYDIIEQYWNAEQSLLFRHAALLLGQQALLDDGQPASAPTPEACLALLREAVEWAIVEPGSKPPVVRRSPVASAYAAVAQWRIDPSTQLLTLLDLDALDPDAVVALNVNKTSAAYLYQAAALDAPQAGDAIAWKLAETRLPEAFEVALAFLPTPEMNYREHNANIRATGMMLLALTAPESRREEITRHVAGRLARERYLERGTAQCALLILGRQDAREEARLLLTSDDFPRRRALTALLIDGDHWTLDWLLWNVYRPSGDLPSLLVEQGISDVLAATAPQLPRPSAALQPASQYWQCNLLKQMYGLFRNQLELGGRP